MGRSWCNCPEYQGFFGDHCPVRPYFKLYYMDFARLVKSSNDCACKFSGGFLEASRVTAVKFCETASEAANAVTRQRWGFHEYETKKRPRSEIRQAMELQSVTLLREWMDETWATEICSAVVSRLEEPSEGIKQLQNSAKPDENMEVRPESRAWYLLEGDQSGHRSLEVALKKVCHDECEVLVKKLKQTGALGMWNVRSTVAEKCSKFVVREVEAETLGCCARSCGWNGATCGLWDFMSDAAQQDWKFECCAEGAILNGSSRQKMCNSVLPQERQRILAEHDEPYNTSGLPSFVGQDFDGIDFPSSSASMLEVVAQVECDERISRCAKPHQTRMWAACATKYHWQILDKDVDTGYCPPDQVITSNRHFDTCKVLENMPNMPNVKWSSDGGEERCTRFDNKCLETLKKSVSSGKLDIKAPDDWEGQEENKNVEVVRFIKLGQ